MAYILNDKIKNLTPYEPITGDYKIRLDANESYIELDTETIKDVLNQNLNRYPDPYAVKLCQKFGDVYNVKPELITAGNGSDELISLIVGTFFTSNDTILTLSNDFSMYKFYGETFGIKTEVFNKNGDLTVNVDGLIKYINENNIAGFIFSNPCNPTSLCLNKEQVIKIIENVNALVVVDEAYMDFYDQSILQCFEQYDNVIVLKTCSKSIGLASIRLGFAVANATLTKALKSVKSPYNVNALTQSVGEIVLSDKAYLKDAVKKLIESREFLYGEILKLQQKYDVLEIVYKPTTNFVFIKTSKSKYIFEQLLSRSIAIRCMGEYLRISAGSPKENCDLIEQIDDILK